MRSPNQGRDEAARNKRVYVGCYLLAWGLIILPLLGVYALGAGLFGRSIAQLPEDLIRYALEMDVLAIIILLASLPLMFVPYWLCTEIRRRKRPGS